MGSDSAVGVGFWGRKGLIYTVLETLFCQVSPISVRIRLSSITEGPSSLPNGPSIDAVVLRYVLRSFASPEHRGYMGSWCHVRLNSESTV